MHKIVFVFILGIAAGYAVAGLADSEVAQSPEVSQEENAVTERMSDASHEQNTARGEPTYKSALDRDLGIRFLYRTAPDAYTVRLLTAAVEDDADFVKGYQLMLTQDVVFMQTAEPTEAPPTIEVRAYKNPDRLAANVWAHAYPQLSNIEYIRADSEDVTVGGAPAVRYETDGLYLTDTVVVASGSMVYVITGASVNDTDLTRVDFEPFLSSFEFLP